MHEGDTVLVEKGGEIIPKIIKVNLDLRKPNTKAIHFIENCPECGTKLVRKEGEAAFYCTNETGCAPQIVGRIQHFTGRKAMDIEGLGDETIEAFFKRGLISKISDLYVLHEKAAELKVIERFGEKSIENMLNGIEQSKQMPFEKVLFGLGIRFVGETVAKRLAAGMRNIDALASASLEQLIAIDEIGVRIAESVIAYFAENGNKAQIEELKNAGLCFELKESENVSLSDKLSGKTFVISGVFEKYSREELKDLITENGGKVVSSISAKLDFLIAGSNMGPAKLEKATKLNIQLISEDDLAKMLDL